MHCIVSSKSLYIDSRLALGMHCHASYVRKQFRIAKIMEFIPEQINTVCVNKSRRHGAGHVASLLLRYNLYEHINFKQETVNKTKRDAEAASASNNLLKVT